MKSDTRLLKTSLLLFVVGVLLLCPIFCRGENRVETLRAKLPYLFYCTGGSLAERPGNEWVQVWPVRWKDLKRGDLVLYFPEGQTHSILHPLWGRFGPLWQAKGTNLRTNSHPDPFYVTPDNIIGIVHPK